MDNNVECQILCKISLQSLKTGLFSLFPNEDHLKFLCAPKSKLLCLGGLVGKSFNFGPNPKRGSALANRCYLCQTNEESIDHLLLHYIKTRAL